MIKNMKKNLIKNYYNVTTFIMLLFIMLLRKGVYPYEYIDEWDKFNEKVLPGKDSFYSNLTLENISEIDYAHANNVFKKININNLGEYHDLYFRSDTLLLADIFENLHNLV